MTEADPTESFRSPDSEEFASTRWSIVLAAGRTERPDSRQALAELCQSYWYPLYAYVRRRSNDPHEAQDLIQEFFSRLLERNALAVANPERGRFRAFLLTSLRHFLNDQWHKSQTIKRGGGQGRISLDFQSAKSMYAIEPTDEQTPERLYDRRWAITLLDLVMTRLSDEFARSGKERHFEQLKTFLGRGRTGTSYAKVARELGISEGAAMVAAHRLRRRYRDLLRAEIAQTVASPAEVDDEIRTLFTCFNG
jgi:RNA polymerase sigma factor (sigma-70 family)